VESIGAMVVPHSLGTCCAVATEQGQWQPVPHVPNQTLDLGYSSILSVSDEGKERQN